MKYPHIKEVSAVATGDRWQINGKAIGRDGYSIDYADDPVEGITLMLERLEELEVREARWLGKPSLKADKTPKLVLDDPEIDDLI